MSRYPLNQPVKVSTTVRGDTGGLVDAGTLTLLVKLAAADGTMTTTGTYASPTHDGLGLYHQDIPVTDLAGLGHYSYTWTDRHQLSVSFGDFDVFDPFEAAVLPLQDAKDMLNIPQATITSDAEIQSWVATIETSLEAMTDGPLINRSITERAELTPDLLSLTLRQRPVVSVTSIVSVPNGATVDISAGLDIDNLAGVVRTKGGWAFSAFSPLATVTYVAGWGPSPRRSAPPPPRILAHLWETQPGPTARRRWAAWTSRPCQGSRSPSPTAPPSS